MKALGYTVSFVLLVVGGTIWRGYVLTKLWAWFMAPTFGFPVLRIPEAIGVSCIAGFLTQHAIKTRDKTKSLADLMGELAILAVVLPALSLLSGWIVTFWMPAK